MESTVQPAGADLRGRGWGSKGAMPNTRDRLIAFAAGSPSGENVAGEIIEPCQCAQQLLACRLAVERWCYGVSNLRQFQ